MRLWSIHPAYLDSKGLTALWREALLARKVLQGKTKGYVKHPQLLRFKSHPYPIDAINLFLAQVFSESERRGYDFDKSKLKSSRKIRKIKVSKGQLRFELKHLKKKLKCRDKKQCRRLGRLKKIMPNPLFSITDGGVSEWEKSAG
jgi:hypothetical protein